MCTQVFYMMNIFSRIANMARRACVIMSPLVKGLESAANLYAWGNHGHMSIRDIHGDQTSPGFVLGSQRIQWVKRSRSISHMLVLGSQHIRWDSRTRPKGKKELCVYQCERRIGMGYYRGQGEV